MFLLLLLKHKESRKRGAWVFAIHKCHSPWNQHKIPISHQTWHFSALFIVIAIDRIYICTFKSWQKKNSLVYRVTARNVNKSTPALQLMICNNHIKETPPLKHLVLFAIAISSNSSYRTDSTENAGDSWV